MLFDARGTATAEASVMTSRHVHHEVEASARSHRMPTAVPVRGGFGRASLNPSPR